MIRPTRNHGRSSRALASLLLGVAGLASLAGPALAQQASGAARLLPEETLLVISVDDHGAYVSSQEGMPLNKIMAEEEMQTFLVKPIALMKEAIGTLAEKIREEEGFENFELSVESLFAGEYGRIFVALTHFAMPDMEAGKANPDLGLILGIEVGKGAPDWQLLVKDLIGRAARNSGLEIGFQPVQSGSHSYEELSGGEGDRPPIVMGRVGDLQLFSTSHESLKMVMDRATGGEAKALAGTSRYQAGQQRLAITGAGAIRLYLNTELIFGTIAEGIKFGLRAENESEYVPLVDKLLHMSGLLGLKTIMSAGVTNDGVAISRLFGGIEGERTGLMALQPTEPIDTAILDTIPKNVTSFSIFQADLAGLYDFAMDVVKTVDAEAYAEVDGMMKGMGAQIAGEGNPPVDLRRDILGNIGPQFMFVQPQSSNAMMPAFLFMADVRNGDQVTGSLTKMLEFGAGMSGGQFSIKTSDYKKTSIHQVDLGAGMGVPISPCFAVYGEQFILSLSVGDLKRHIRRSEKGGESVKENEDFQRFFPKVPQDAHLTSLSYTDVRFSVESAYGSLAMAVPMLTMAADFELPVDMALLPTQEAITQHLYGSLSFSVEDESGGMFESYGPIGGEALGLLVMCGIGVGALAGVHGLDELSGPAVSPGSTSPLEETPSDQVRYNLSNLKAGVTIYKLQSGSVPTDLAQLLEPSDAYPQGCLGQDTIPSDPWGNAYKYKTTTTGYVLWSCGPNGTDEDGQGDDIAREKK